MKRGKRICKTLKEVRMQVAKANDIKYAPTECHHEGDCAGTCPKCEAEVRWLEQQLQLRRQLGKAVAVVGVSVGLAALTACNSKTPTTESDRDTVSIESQTAGFLDMVPDTLSEGSQIAETDIIDYAEHHPQLPIVMIHMGHAHGVYVDAAITMARRYDNIWLETSGTSMSCQIKNAYDTVGHERVMFGIDSPFHHPTVEIQKVMACGVDESGLENIFYNNAKALMKL